MEENEFVLTPQNYYTKEASEHYLSFHDYLDFAGGMKTYGCEARAMAKMRGEWQDEITLPLLVGGYCDAYLKVHLMNGRTSILNALPQRENLKHRINRLKR